MRVVLLTAIVLAIFAGCDFKPYVAVSDPLLEAMENGDVAAVNDILNSDPGRVDAALVTGMSPLYHAVLREQDSIVKAILDHGADPSAYSSGVVVGGSKDRPILLAIRLGEVISLEMMLNKWDFGHSDHGLNAEIRDEVQRKMDADPVVGIKLREMTSRILGD